MQGLILHHIVDLFTQSPCQLLWIEHHAHICIPFYFSTPPFECNPNGRVWAQLHSIYSHFAELQDGECFSSSLQKLMFPPGTKLLIATGYRVAALEWWRSYVFAVNYPDGFPPGMHVQNKLTYLLEECALIIRLHVKRYATVCSGMNWAAYFGG